MAASALKIESNRANAQHSTGPVSPEGKEISAKNATKHNLTGGPPLAPGEDEAAFKAHCEQYKQDYRPDSLPERELVDQLADASWRLLRVAKMERELLAAHPNPFLTPDDPASVQLVLLTRYRNSIQRTYDRAYRELQVLTEAAQIRLEADTQSIREMVKEDIKAAGLDLASPEVQARIEPEVKIRMSRFGPERARFVLALRNRSQKDRR